MKRLPTKYILLAVLIASALPFLLVELFPGWLYHVMGTDGYLVFHNVAEFFSVMVSLSIFGVGWFSFDQSQNRHILFLSASFLAVGLMDSMHALGYTGMPAFVTPNSITKASQYWIAARFVDASAFLASAFILPESRSRWLSKPVLLAAGFGIPALVFTGVTFFPDQVPATFVPGIGLTPFKKMAEYVIICLLLLSSVASWRRLARSGDRTLVYCLAAFIICIFSEVVFTFYRSVFDTYNLLGHIYKIVAFSLIYAGTFATSVRRPWFSLYEEMEEHKRAKEETRTALEELQEKNELLIQQSRQAAMGEMIGHIAHQWRQPLNALGLNVQELELLFDLEQLDRGALINNIATSMQLITHMSETIDDFRYFFKPEKEKGEFRTSEAVINAVQLTRGSFKEHRIEVEVLEEDEGSVIYGYRNEFAQVLLNILNNARDALTERGVRNPKVTISIFRDEGRASITVADNAGGVDDGIIHKIFDPYFTTKGPQQGTGVGLFMSKMIIEKNMGGRLSVRNWGDGAEFRIEM